MPGRIKRGFLGMVHLLVNRRLYGKDKDRGISRRRLGNVVGILSTGNVRRKSSLALMALKGYIAHCRHDEIAFLRWRSSRLTGNAVWVPWAWRITAANISVNDSSCRVGIAHRRWHPGTLLVGDAHPTGARVLSKCHSCQRGVSRLHSDALIAGIYSGLLEIEL